MKYLRANPSINLHFESTTWKLPNKKLSKKSPNVKESLIVSSFKID